MGGVRPDERAFSKETHADRRLPRLRGGILPAAFEDPSDIYGSISCPGEFSDILSHWSFGALGGIAGGSGIRADI